MALRWSAVIKGPAIAPRPPSPMVPPRMRENLLDRAAGDKLDEGEHNAGDSRKVGITGRNLDEVLETVHYSAVCLPAK